MSAAIENHLHVCCGQVEGMVRGIDRPPELGLQAAVNVSVARQICEAGRQDGRTAGRQDGRTAGRQDDRMTGRQDDRTTGRQDDRQVKLA